jgi:hypothetical protein
MLAVLDGAIKQYTDPESFDARYLLFQTMLYICLMFLEIRTTGSHDTAISSRIKQADRLPTGSST